MYMKVEKGGAEKITVETLLSYEGMIRTTAAKYLGKQFGGWAADVTQDVLVKAWTRQDKYVSSKGELVNWLYTMTKNACLDLMNKKGNNVEALVFDVDFVSSLESDADMRYASMKGALREALNELGHRDKTLLIMRYYFKSSGREIAEFLGMPENQVASYMKRAKERLRDLLDYPQAA
jgi:RNA polymerase sigma-70 factor (ECF subfamily)